MNHVSCTSMGGPAMRTRSCTAREKNNALCCICGESTPKARPYTCDHMFHLNCLIKWSARESSCPVCRDFFTYIICSNAGVYSVPDRLQHNNSDSE